MRHAAEKKENTCSVSGCKEVAVKTMSSKKLEDTGLNVGASRRCHLCKAHYREVKKATKKESKLERLGR